MQIVFEIPSNLALKRLGARIWIPIIMGVWGVIMMAMAAAKSGRELMVARFFLGAAESGLYPVHHVVAVNVWLFSHTIEL